MVISFNQIPQRLIPFVAVEFDNSQASQGPALQQYKLLLMGQKLAAGSGSPNVVYDIASLSQAKSLFGDGSDLAFMVQSALKNNTITDLLAIALDDDGAAVKATGKITVAAGTAGAAGAMYVYIAGRRIPVAVAAGDDQDDIAAAIVAAIAAYTDDMLPVTAAVNGVNAEEVDITANQGGETGNKIDIRLNYAPEDAFPKDITATVTPMASGATNPSLTTALAGLGAEQYNVIAFPWVDSTSLTAIENEFSTRWGATVALESQGITCQYESRVNLSALGNARNSQFNTIIGEKSLPSMPLEVAAGAAALVALYGAQDPARPFQTLEIKGILPPAPVDRFSEADRDTLLNDGIATLRVSAGNRMQIEYLVTTYKTDSLENPDVSFQSLNRMLILSYLRFDTRTFLGLRYARVKVADDGTRIAPGAAIVTPGILRAEMVARARQWEALGLVENIDQFKQDIVVERNAINRDRIDILMSPDLINQLRQIAVKAAFIV